MNTTKITARKVVLTSLAVNILDLVLNLFVALITGSVVMLTEALQGAADLASSSFLFIGLKKSQKAADRMHPFGYGRELYFWALMSGMVMFGITATASIYLGIKRINNPEPVKYITLAILVLVIGVITNGYSFTLSFRRLLGKQTIGKIWFIFMHSSIVETKTALVLDLMGTLAALFGLVSLLIYKFTGNTVFDGLGAVMIGFMLASLSLILLKGIKELLVGQSASLETEKRIRQIVKNTPEVVRVIDLKTIYVGPRKLIVSLEVNLKDELNTDKIEQVIDRIQKKVRKKIPRVHDVQVELESPG